MFDCLAKTKSVFEQEIKEKVKLQKQSKISSLTEDLKCKLHLGIPSLHIFQIAIILIHFNYKEKNPKTTQPCVLYIVSNTLLIFL